MKLEEKRKILSDWVDINTLVDEPYRQSAAENRKKLLEIDYSILFAAQNGNRIKANRIADKYINEDFYPTRA